MPQFSIRNTSCKAIKDFIIRLKIGLLTFKSFVYRAITFKSAPTGIVSLSLFFLLTGLNSQLRAQEYTQVIYDESRGLDRNYVNDIVRDSHGLFWLATDRGVVRFDGLNFLPVKTGEGAEPNIIRLRLFGEQLFLITYNSGVIQLDLSNFSSKIITRDPAIDALQLPDESLVIMFSDGRLIRYASGQPVADFKVGAHPYPYLGGAMYYAMNKLFIQSDSSGLQVADPESLRPIQKIPIPCCSYTSEFQESDGKLRVSTKTGNFLISSDFSFTTQNIVSSSDLATHTNLRQWSSSLHFYLNKEKEVVRATNKNITRFPVQGKWISGLRTLFVYDSVNILVGANGGLVHLKISHPAFRSTDADEAASAPDFRVRRKIIPVDEKSLVLLGNPGFIIWDGAAMKRVPAVEPISTYDGALFGGNLYATTERHFLARYELFSGAVKQIWPKGIAATDKLYCIGIDAAKKYLVIGGTGAIFRFDPLSGKAVRFNSIGTSSARVIAEIPNGSGWCVGTTDGLYILNTSLQQVAHMRKADGLLRGETVADIRFVAKDSLWVAHEQGAELVNLGSRQTLISLPENVFPDPRVTAILVDDRDRLWFSTFKGILGYDPQTQARIKVTGTSGVLINREFNFKSALTLPDGRLMFGGLSGYDFVEPGAFPFNRSVSDGLIAGYERIGEEGAITTRLQEINPASISFDTEHESLRIMLTTGRPLEAIDNTYEFRYNGGIWTSFYGKAPFEIYKLRPGSYTLEFRAFDPFGVMITFPPVSIHAEVPFYKSTAFIWSVSLIIAAMAIFIVFILLSAGKRERKIKEDISMDLHDELGTLLTKSLLLFRKDDQADRRSQAEQYLQEALHSLRVFITTMKRSEIPLERLVVEIKETMLTSFSHESMTSEVRTITPPTILIDSGLYRDIKLCIFELISNIMKYSAADRVTILVDQQPYGIALRISDNGRLTSLDTLENKGSGISNLRKRTGKYRGTAKFSVTEGSHGLTVDLFFAS